MHPFGHFRNWTNPHGQVDPSMWNSTASSVPQHPGIGGFVSGCDPTLQSVQQQQAQSQAQIELLRQQDLLLNQQLATQANTHIQQLHTLQSQSVPPQPHHSSTPPSSSAIPSTEPPPSSSKDVSAPDPSLLFKQMTEQLAEKLTSSVRDLRDADNQRREDELRALREQQVQATTSRQQCSSSTSSFRTSVHADHSRLSEPLLSSHLPPSLRPASVTKWFNGLKLPQAQLNTIQSNWERLNFGGALNRPMPLTPFNGLPSCPGSLSPSSRKILTPTNF